MLEVSFNRCPYDTQMTDYPCRFVCIKFFVYLYFGCFMLIIKNSFWNTNQICNLRNNFIGAVFVGDSIICGNASASTRAFFSVTAFSRTSIYAPFAEVFFSTYNKIAARKLGPTSCPFAQLHIYLQCHNSNSRKCAAEQRELHPRSY